MVTGELPARVLRSWQYDANTPKGYKDIGMEGMVAKWHATNTAKSIDEFTSLARRIASRIPPGGSVLDVALGQCTSPLSWRSWVRTRSKDSTSAAPLSNSPARERLQAGAATSGKAALPHALRQRYFRLPVTPRGVQELRRTGRICRRCATCLNRAAVV